MEPFSVEMSQEKEKRFAEENWKILEDFNEERKRLKIFSEDTIGSLSNEGSLTESYLGERNTNKSLNVEAYIKSDDSASCPKSRESSQMSVRVWTMAPCASNIDVLLDKSSTGPVTESSGLPGSDLPTIASGCKLENLIPGSLASVVTCLFNVEPFKLYLEGILKFVLDDGTFAEATYSSLTFLCVLLRLLQADCADLEMSILQTKLKQKNLHAALAFESVACIFTGILETLHDEFVLAKKAKLLQNWACVSACRMTHRENHSVISHLFRGHCRRKVFCSCGYIDVKDEPFTSLIIPLDELEQKTIIVSLAGVASESMQYTVTRYLLLASNWSSVAALVETLLAVSPIGSASGDSVVCLVRKGKIVDTLAGSTRVFDLMCKEGEIWIFDASAGMFQHTGSSVSRYHRKMRNVFENIASMQVPSADERNLMASSPPAVTDISDSDQSTLLNVHAIKHVRRSSYVLVRVQCLLPSSVVPLLQMVLRFSRVCHGMHLFERLARIFHLVPVDLQTLVIVILNKADQCIFCLSQRCNGCPVQLNDKLVLGNGYTISVTISKDSPRLIFIQNDHESLLHNGPISCLTFAECFTGFAESKPVHVCPSCIKSAWLPSETVMMKAPDILTVQFDLLAPKSVRLHYPKRAFTPQMYRRSTKLAYTLKAIAFGDADCQTFLCEHDATSWSKISLGGDKSGPEFLPSTLPDMVILTKSEGSSGVSLSSQLQKRIAKKMKSRQKSWPHSKKRSLAVEGTDAKFDSVGGFDGMSSHLLDERMSICTCARCQCLERARSQLAESQSSYVRPPSPVDDAVHSLEELSDLSHSSSRSASSCASFILEKALHKAIRKQNFKAAVTILKKGADVNHLIKGVAALHLAVGLSPPFGPAFTKLCLENGSDPNMVSVGNATALHIAVMLGQEEIVQQLIGAGAVPQMRDSSGLSAFDIVARHGSRNVERILRMLRGESTADTDAASRDLKVPAEAVSLEEVSVGSQLHVGGHNQSSDYCDENSNAVEGAKQVIGETTFDKVFFHHYLTTLDGGSCRGLVENAPTLLESPLSTSFDAATPAPSYDSRRVAGWEFLCSGGRSAVRLSETRRRFGIFFRRQLRRVLGCVASRR